MPAETVIAREGLNVDFSSSDEAAFQKLKLGRVELTPQDEGRGWWMIDRLFPGQADRFATQAKPFELSQVCLMVSRGYPNTAALLVRFNKGLAAIRAKGVYRQIHQFKRCFAAGSPCS